LKVKETPIRIGWPWCLSAVQSEQLALASTLESYPAKVAEIAVPALLHLCGVVAVAIDLR